MACIEHDCKECGAYWADNGPRYQDCPECGSHETVYTFDEEGDE